MGDNTGQGEETGGNTTNGEQTGDNDSSNWFESIFGAIGNIFTSVKEMASYLNPFSENFILKGVLSNLGNIINYINPLSDNFILNSVLDFLGNILSYINPFGENFILKDLFTWLNNFFTTLKEFFINIFVPTEEQWADLDAQDAKFKEQIEGKFPFFYWFQDELKKADEYVYSDDFLNIHFNSWDMDLGIIKYKTPEIDFTAFRDAYAPYRVTIRNSLFIIAVGMALVYLIKYFMNYSITSSDVQHIGNSSSVSSSDAWHIDGQISLVV